MRPEGLSKLGYYPTPAKTSREIAEMVLLTSTRELCQAIDAGTTHAPGQASVHVLDPCCGDGTAVQSLAGRLAEQIANYCRHPEHRITVRTHGIEPHAERARAAAQALDSAMPAPIEQCRIPHAAYDALLLNPPYDYDNEHEYSRLETYFLNVATPALKPGGLLVLIIPQYVVPDAARSLASNYRNVTAFRMSDPEYRQFRQSVIFAQREKELDMQLPSPWTTEQLLAHAGNEAGAQSLSACLQEPDHRKHAVSLTAQGTRQEPRITKVQFNPQAIMQAADRQSAFNTEPVSRLVTPRLEQPPFEPLEPLRRGHVCLLAANGQLDNIPLYDAQGVLDPVIIKGSSEKQLVDTANDPEKRTVTAQERFAAKISVMNLRNGDISVISENTDDLTGFFAARQDSIDQAVQERYRPRVNPMAPKYEEMRRRLTLLSRTLLGKQAPSAIAVAAQLREKKHCFCIGQQGSGKTTVAIAAVQAAAFSTVLVVTPSHNVTTWADEIRETNPEARVRVVNGIGQRGRPDQSTYRLPYAETDIETIRETPADPDHPVYAVMGRDGQNKLTYPFKILARPIGKQRPLYRMPVNPGDFKGPRLRTVNLLEREGKERKRNSAHGPRSQPAELPAASRTCPNCWVPFRAGKLYPSGRQAKCHVCRMPLAAPDVKDKGDRVYARARYIGKRLPKWADLFIVDEAHQFRGKASAQAEVYGALAQRSRRVLALTGTLIGGKASECFRLLASMCPSFYDGFTFHDRKRFTEIYGRYQVVFETQHHGEQVGKRSSRRAQGCPPKELNGFHPAMMSLFWPSAVFMRITDIKRDLPDPEVYVHLCELDATPVNTADGAPTSQQESYRNLEDKLKENLEAYLAKRDLSPLGQYLQELLVYPENCWQGTAPLDADSVKKGQPKPIVEMPPLPADRLYPKETRMLEIIAGEVAAGRKTLVYVTHTKRRNTAQRLLKLLENHLIRARIMPDGNAKGRLHWIRKTAAATDVIICHPRKVETGLNLLEFPTILWYEHDPSMYTVEQASARSHRANQTRTVHVHHLAYAGTMQEKYLRLIAEKADASRMIYGELGANGLSAFNPGSNELRQVVAQEMMRGSAGHPDQEIDRVSKAMSSLLYVPEQDLQDAFRSVRQSRQESNARAAETLYEGPEFETLQNRPAIPARPPAGSAPARQPEAVTWEQWRQANNLKENSRQPGNQLVLL